MNKTLEIESVSGVEFAWKHISMDTLARICETLDHGIIDVIELTRDEPSATRGNDRFFYRGTGWKRLDFPQGTKLP